MHAEHTLKLLHCKVHCIIEKLFSTCFFTLFKYLNQKLFLKFKKAMHKIHLSLEPGVGFLEMLDQLFVNDLRTETVGSSN